MIPQPLLWVLVLFAFCCILSALISLALVRSGKRYDESEPNEMDYDPSSLGKED